MINLNSPVFHQAAAEILSAQDSLAEELQEEYDNEKHTRAKKKIYEDRMRQEAAELAEVMYFQPFFNDINKQNSLISVFLAFIKNPVAGRKGVYKQRV